jgi:ankyrin repeat protein
MSAPSEERIAEIKEIMKVGYQDQGQPRIMALANQSRDGGELLDYFVKQNKYDLFKEFNHDRPWYDKALNSIYKLFGSQYKPEKNVNGFDNSGNTPINHLCIYPGTLKVLVEDLGADVNKKNRNPGTTPVIAAAAVGSYESVAYLMSKGANLEAVDNNGRNILHHIAMEFSRNTEGQLKVVDLLAEKPGLLKKLAMQTDKSGKDPLEYGAANTKPDTQKLRDKLEQILIGKPNVTKEEGVAKSQSIEAPKPPHKVRAKSSDSERSR